MLLKLRNLRPLSTVIQNEFKTIYKFPYIQHIAVVQRLKLYHTTLTAAAVTSTTVLGYCGQISLEITQGISICSIVGLLPFYTFGHFTHKLVGFVYLNENRNLARISYIDFWGRRKNTDMPVEEVSPKIVVLDSFLNLFYSPGDTRSYKNTMKLCSNHGIIDFGGFNKIFYK